LLADAVATADGLGMRAVAGRARDLAPVAAVGARLS
jgi:hypothetical protein